MASLGLIYPSNLPAYGITAASTMRAYPCREEIGYLSFEYILSQLANSPAKLNI